jgi:hypothetical protein
MERMNLSEMQSQGGGGIPTGAIIFLLVVSILMIASLWKVYTKAGKPGWAAIIPIYNLVVLLQIVRKPMWWIVMFLIPFVNFIFVILLYIELAKAFGKGGGFAAGLIFLSIIFFPILGFGSSQYVLASAAAPNAAT